MAKTKISEFSTTAGNNTDINSINIAEGCAPSGINDAIRELMRQLKEFQTGGAGDSVNSGGDFSVATNKFTVASASGNTAVAGTLAVTGVATLTAQPILSSLTASKAVFTDASKGLVSNDVTGTGNVVMSNSPTLVTPALGTPSSGVVTNLTGTASININGTVGATTPSTGAFTTLSSTGNTTLGDADTDTLTFNASFVTGTTLKSAKLDTNTLALAAYDVDGTAYTNLVTLTAGNSPTLALTSTGVGTINNMSIGATTASTGAFTTLSASGNVTLSGGTANGVLYLNGSKVATSGSALTFDGSQITLNGAYALSGDDFVYSYAGGTSGQRRAGFYLDGTNGQIRHYIGGSEAMRLTSTGLGIGTSSPGYKLQVTTSATGAIARLNTTGGTRGARIEFGLGENAGGAESYIDFSGTSGTSTGVFKASGVEVMRLDSSGNLGLGVTPSAWTTSGPRVFDIGTRGALVDWSSSQQTDIWSNGYFDGTNSIYKTTANASIYRQSSGQHIWYNAPSGTAGNAITFTQAMTLDASGNLGIGTSSPVSKLHVNGGDGNNIRFQGTTDTVALGLNGTTPFVGTVTNGSFAIQTNATTRALIDTSGNLLVAKTSDTFSTVGIVLRANGSIAATSDGNEVIDINRLTSDGGIQRFFRSGTQVGSISVTTSATAYNTSSDYRLKDNPQPLTGSGAFIDALKPKTWNWKADGSRGVGFIAHEVQAVSPGSVTGEKDGEQMQAMEYGSAEFIANIIAELQSLRARVAQLESK